MSYEQVLEQARFRQNDYLKEAERDSLVQEAKQQAKSRSLRQLVAQKLVELGESLTQQPQKA